MDNAQFRKHFPDLSPATMDIYFGRACELEIVRSLGELFTGSLLDIGCGRMPYREILSVPKGKVSRYIGMDIYNEAYQDGDKPDLYWDGKRIPIPDGSVDRAFATSLFEHIAEPLETMRETRRVLKQDGILFLTVPFLWPLHDAPHDFHRFSPFALDHLLREAGFGDILLKPMGGWNAAMAQMLGLWINRSGLPEETRKSYGDKFFELYQNLLATDRLPEKYSSRLLTPGFAGLAFAGEAPAPEMFGFHKRGLVGIAQKEPLPVPVTSWSSCETTPMKIIHLFPGRNHHHVPELINSFWQNADGMGTRREDHIFFVNDDHTKFEPEVDLRYRALGIPSANLRFYTGYLSDVFDFLNRDYPEAPILMHSGFFHHTWQSIARTPAVWNRLGWVIWGGDLMESKRLSESEAEEDRMHLGYRKDSIPHLRWIISCCRCTGDFDIVKNLFGDTNNFSSAFYFDSGVEAGELVSRPLKTRGDRVRILLGNSGATSNNHLEAMEWLARYRDEAIEIVCPLSYGSRNGYAESVAAKGRELFADKFRPLLTVMGRNDYNELLDSIDILVFNHQRQQGVTNLYYLLLSGRKCFIRKNTSVGRLLDENGITARESLEIAELDFQGFAEPETEETVSGNRAAFMKNLSRHASIASWRELFSEYRKSAGLGDVQLEKPLITIGIATYNRAKMIAPAIESALRQTGSNWEILVADDGSTDETEAVAASFKDRRIRYLKLEHHGTPTTRNAAIDAARGEFVLWLDSDDALAPDALERYTREVEAHPEVDVFYGDWQNADEEFNNTDTQTFENWFERRDELLPTMIWKSSIPHGGTLIRKRIFIEAGYYDPAFPSGHDDQFWSRAVQFAEFRHIGGMVYTRRKHPGSLTKARVDRQRSNRSRIIKQMIERYDWRRLFPELEWESEPEELVRALAMLKIGGGLFNVHDWDSAIEYMKRSDATHHNPLVARFIAHIESERERALSEGEIPVAPAPAALAPDRDPCFTVGIIAYNAERFIGEAIRSALAQDYAHFEVLVADDGSTDSTVEIIHSFADPRLRCVRLDHRGAPATRNSLIAEARGEAVVWLDADDLLLPKTLAKYAEILRSHPDADVVYGDWINADESLKLIGPQRFGDWYAKRNEMIGKLLWETVVPNGGTMIRKSLFERLGGYDETFLSCHDDQFWSRAAATAVFKHCCAAVYKRRQHAGSMTRGRKDKQNHYHPLIVKGLLKLYDLRLIVPEVPWGSLPFNEAEAMAHVRVAERFLSREAYADALEQLRISQSLHPNPGTAKAIQQLEAIGNTNATAAAAVSDRVRVDEEGMKSAAPLPFVSVLIPTYNRAGTLAAAVESALLQDYLNFEVVVVDDGSTDESLAILAGYNDPRLRVIQTGHVGAPEARNRGILEAKGEFILWLDSDDLLLPKCIASQVAALAKSPDADVVYGDLVMVDNDLKLIKAERYEDWARRERDLPPRLFWGNTIPNPGTMIRKELFDRTGGYDAKFPMAHDYEFWSRAAAVGKFKHSGAAVCKYRRHSENTSPEKMANYKILDSRVVEGMLSRYPLRNLIPGAPWGKLPPAEAEAAARIVAAERLLGLGAVEAGLNQLAAAQSLAPNPAIESQIQVLRRMQNGKAPKPKRDRLKIVALIAAYNEGDVIREVIGDLIRNGVEVYLIDNHSTDETVAEAMVWDGRGLIGAESYPPEGSEVPAGVYAWTEILRRKEELAQALNADWVIHADADEFRESPFPGQSLREGIEFADRLGYNAIGFDLYNFRPTDDSFQPHGDVRPSLRFYDRPGAFDLDQVKAWKSDGARVELALSGGHEAMFAGRKVFPIPFILRHYPIRSEAHGLKKVFGDRIPRFTETERAKGWHVQYDEFDAEKPQFIYREEELTEWNGGEVRAAILGRALKQLLLVQDLKGEPDHAKVDGARLMAKLQNDLKMSAPPPVEAVRAADRALTSRFNAMMTAENPPPAPADELTAGLMRQLGRVKSAISALEGGYKAAAVWEAAAKSGR